MEADPNIVAQLHSQLVPDLENSDDSASDEEEDAFNWEWEAVSSFLFFLSYFHWNLNIFYMNVLFYRYQMLLVLKWQFPFLVQWLVNNLLVCK